MRQEIEAIVDHGMLKPLQRLDLEEGKVVTISWDDTPAAEQNTSEAANLISTLLNNPIIQENFVPIERNLTHER